MMQAAIPSVRADAMAWPEAKRAQVAESALLWVNAIQDHFAVAGTPPYPAWKNDPASLRAAAQILVGLTRAYPLDLARYRWSACRANARARELDAGSASEPAPSPQAAPKVAAPAAAPGQDLSDPTIRAPSWNTVDWNEAAMMEAGQALEEVLNSSTFDTAQDASLPQRVIARDGKVAECVSLETITTTDSKLGGGGRVLVNNCSDPVEIGWCTVGGECERGMGNSWTVQPGRSWPVSAEKEIRWGACHGANTFQGDRESNGTRFTCSAPAGTPPSSEVPTGAGRSNEN